MAVTHSGFMGYQDLQQRFMQWNRYSQTLQLMDQLCNCLQPKTAIETHQSREVCTALDQFQLMKCMQLMLPPTHSHLSQPSFLQSSDDRF